MSFCANAGVSLDIVAEVVGHGSPVMTRHYAHISDVAKTAILNALPSQQTKNETKDSTAPENPTRYELMEKLSKLSPDKIDKLLKFVEEK